MPENDKYNPAKDEHVIRILSETQERMRSYILNLEHELAILKDQEREEREERKNAV